MRKPERLRRAVEAPPETIHTDRLTHFEVHGLFHQFTYRIPLNIDDRITAIIAPNGSGKTICLRLINAFFSRKWSFYNEIIFDRIELKFLSNRKIIIDRPAKLPGAKVDLPEGEKLNSEPRGIRFSVYIPNQNPINWTPTVTVIPGARNLIERYLSFLTRTAPDQWTHDHSGEKYTLQEVVQYFGDSLPETFTNNIYADMPAPLSELVNGVDCHLIETQRLLVLQDDDEELPYRRSRPLSSFAISKKAASLRSIISQQLTAYAALSQSLDRSFPHRVIKLQKISHAENLKTQLEELDKRRKGLMEAGILDTEADDPVVLPEGPMEEAISRVLSVYATDTFRKLNSLATLLARIQLFKELINERLSTKVLNVTKDAGFEVLAQAKKNSS